MKKTLRLQGLDCAGCAAELEAQIASIKGVGEASVSFVTQKLTVSYTEDSVLARVIDCVENFEEVRVLADEETSRKIAQKHTHGDGESHHHEHHEHHHAHGGCGCGCECGHTHGQYHKESHENSHEHVHTHHETGEDRKKAWFWIGFSAVFFIIAQVLDGVFQGLIANIFAWGCFAAAYISVGAPVLLATVKNIRKGRVFDENFLMTVASLGAVCIGEISEGVLVMLLYQIGELLQSIAVGSSRKSVAALMELKSERANLFIENEVQEVEPESLSIGDTVLVKTGEKIPVDGVLTDDMAVLDTKSLTGEAVPKTVEQGGELLSGCINVGGAFRMRVERLYENSAVGRILDMVENAASGKAAPEKFITKFARYYTPAVCMSALALALFAPLLTGIITTGAFAFINAAYWIKVALTFLVISCPCALIISVPLTYFSGIGRCAKNGVLVKGAVYLDVAAKAKQVAFDKTGTLTEGSFRIRGIHAESGINDKELLALATALERASAHPIAAAFLGQDTPYFAENVTEIAGRGLVASVNGKETLVGNEKLLAERGVVLKNRDSAYSLVYVAQAGKYLGCIEVGDTLRAEAAAAVNALKTMGFTRLVMLTGDGQARAKKIAEEIGLQEVRAGLLPDEKLKAAEELKAQGEVLYIGDGINDAPVMATANCSVSMGKLGSAAAIEASDMVLISDNLSTLPKGIAIARKTRAIVIQNIVFSLVMKLTFMVLGACGVLPLGLAVFADVGVMLLAVLNSFRAR